MTAIGVLCARVRVEEKQIIAALGDAGAVAMPIPPATTPLPPGPAPGIASALGELIDATTGERLAQPIRAVIDRSTNRAVTAAMLPLLRDYGIRTIDAGLAATGTRLQIASVLALAGIPRPRSMAAFSEASGVAAAGQIGYPATLLGLTPGSSTTALHDRDTADAVIEHRVVLGHESEAIVVVQAGAPPADARSTVLVIGGRAIAVDGQPADTAAVAIAERAAAAVGGWLTGIELAWTDDGLVVWDVLPVPDFRTARLLGDVTVAAAIAGTVFALPVAANGRITGEDGWTATASRGYALSA